MKEAFEEKQLIYTFRAQLQNKDFTIYRDIVILPNQCLYQFLKGIRTAYAFDHSQDSEFYNCLSNGIQGKEVPLESNPKISDIVNEPHQRFLYIYDAKKLFTFNIELIYIKEGTYQSYPQCVKTVGIAPSQYRPEEIKEQFDPQKVLYIKSSLRYTNL